MCLPGACNDATRNGRETGVDCGGPVCSPCANGLMCTIDRDCASNSCAAGTCQAPACTDLRQNGGESDIDCGGMCTVKCLSGRRCGTAADCQSAVCQGGTCQGAQCNDGAKNGGETGVDCGGSACAACPAGAGCRVNTDCQSQLCLDAGTSASCTQPSCTDVIRNGNETDVDCGGPDCLPCALGRICAVHADCAYGACDLDSRCAVARSQFVTWKMPDSPTAACYQMDCIGDAGVLQDGRVRENVPSYQRLAQTTVEPITSLEWEKTVVFSGTGQAAIDYCAALQLAGKTDWRLPTLVEMVSIFDLGRVTPALDTSAFVQTVGQSTYLTSTFLANGNIYHVNFGGSFGEVIVASVPFTATGNARCVRP
jgi:hypothetical protein